MRSQATKFLVVEDNDLDVEKIARGFRKLNMPNEIIHAHDGIDALNILRGTEHHPPLAGPYVVLLDINMPRMNGLELLEEIRADKRIAHAPVVIISSSDRPTDVEAAYNRNVNGYLVKPMETNEMYEALKTLNSYWEACEIPNGR